MTFTVEELRQGLGFPETGHPLPSTPALHTHCPCLLHVPCSLPCPIWCCSQPHRHAFVHSINKPLCSICRVNQIPCLPPGSSQHNKRKSASLLSGPACEGPRTGLGQRAQPRLCPTGWGWNSDHWALRPPALGRGGRDAAVCAVGPWS